MSIEAREGISTGISAHDRARTILTACDPECDAWEVWMPGHVFPLRRWSAVQVKVFPLERAGQAERKR